MGKKRIVLHIYAKTGSFAVVFPKGPNDKMKVPLLRPQRGSLTASLRPFDDLKEA